MEMESLQEQLSVKLNLLDSSPSTEDVIEIKAIIDKITEALEGVSFYPNESPPIKQKCFKTKKLLFIVKNDKTKYLEEHFFCENCQKYFSLGFMRAKDKPLTLNFPARHMHLKCNGCFKET